MRRPLAWALGVAALVVLLVLPLSARPYVNLQLTLIATYAIAIRGLDVLAGHAGQASLGQSAFFGLGAYTAAYAYGHDWPIVASLAVTLALAGAVGAVIAVPAVRVRGFAFGIITLTLPVVAVPLATRLSDLTGGSQGQVVTAGDAPGWTGLADDQWHYYVVLAAAATTFLLVQNLLRGRVGRALDLLRTDETVATSTGIPVRRYKVLAFTVAALCGALAGWLYLIPVQFISPDALRLDLSVSLLVAAVIGGLRSPVGAVIGAAFYVLVPNLTDKISPGRSYLVSGVVLLLVLLFFRTGVSGGLSALVRRVAARWRPPPSDRADPTAASSSRRRIGRQTPRRSHATTR
ncbi:MAG TPA: branched-chain amino acid ABC transporter permease [Mycobacteriales bacterium]|jgi:branched-chain amino acid transport system permease protein|nr:branched-chain amino acid ABC transporter permease [Mycobacteriales bacterium]